LAIAAVFLSTLVLLAVNGTDIAVQVMQLWVPSVKFSYRRFTVNADRFNGKFAMTAGTPSRLGLIVLAIIAAPHSSWPDEPSPAAKEVQQILEIAWKPSQDNFAAAKPHYEAAKQMAPGDVRVSYAMALVAIRNHSSADASQYLEEALQNGKSLLPIRRVAIWNEALHKNRPAIVRDIQELARVLAADEKLSNRPDYQDSARWLGIVLGYYAGPGKADMPAAEREALAADVKSKLKGSLAQPLADGTAAFQKQFDTLHDQATAAHINVLGKNVDTRNTNLQNIDAQIADAQKTATEAETQLLQIRAQHNADELERQYNSLKHRLDELRNDQQKTQKDQDSEERHHEKGDGGIKDYSHELAVTGQQIAAVEQQLAPLIGPMQQLQALSAPSQAVIAGQQMSLKSLYKKRQPLAKPASENDEHTNVLDAHIRSFTTYAGVDLEQEKKRILDSYGTK
jgi:hypothetical protein